jgi:hypothetical protein
VVVPTKMLPDVACSLLWNTSLTSTLCALIRHHLEAVLFYTADPPHSSNRTLVVVLTDSPTPGNRLGGSSYISDDVDLSTFRSSGVVLLALSSLLQPLLSTVLRLAVSVLDASAAPVGELIVEHSYVVVVCVISVLYEDFICVCCKKTMRNQFLYHHPQ